MPIPFQVNEQQFDKQNDALSVSREALIETLNLVVTLAEELPPAQYLPMSLLIQKVSTECFDAYSRCTAAQVDLQNLAK